MAYVNFYTAANHVESVSSFPLFEKTEAGGLAHSRWRLSCARRQCGLGLGGVGLSMNAILSATDHSWRTLA